jgi:hypothetical protein
MTLCLRLRGAEVGMDGRAFGWSIRRGHRGEEGPTVAAASLLPRDTLIR